MPKTTKQPDPMEAFYVLEKSEDGIKVELTLPDGTDTKEFLIVRGADSKVFKAAQAKSNREALELARKVGKDSDPVKTADTQSRLTTKLVASLVADWSFDIPCNTKNVCEFLKNSPQIQEQVDQVAAQRKNFFTKPPTN